MIHCVCHRLALIVTDAFKGTQDIVQVVPNECLELLTAVFNYFEKKKEITGVSRTSQ